MDKIRAFIDEITELYSCDTWDDAILHCFKLTGFDWIRDKEFDWDLLSVHSMELETLSALEFLKPELNDFQLDILGKWKALYREWCEQGIFYERYKAVGGTRFTWQEEREYAAEVLGRSIPQSHWWFWPPDEKPGRG